MAKHTLKILMCEHHKIFQVYLTIFQHYERKGLTIVQELVTDLFNQ